MSLFYPLTGQSQNPSSSAPLKTLEPKDFIDPRFIPQTDGSIFTVAQQDDGKILIGGKFTRINNIPANDLARLNPDGSVDSTFNFGAGVTNSSSQSLTDGTAASRILAILVQSDGKIIVGGEFDRANEYTSFTLVRLHGDGSVDNTFQARKDQIQALDKEWSYVDTLRFGEDGKLLALGAHPSSSRNPLAFTSQGIAETLPFIGRSQEWFMPRQSTGKIIRYQSFVVPPPTFERLYPDRSPDDSFIPEPGYVPDWASPRYTVQPNNRIVFIRNRISPGLFEIARFHPDGPADRSFHHVLDQNATIHALPDGSIVLMGFFSMIDGLPRPGIARILPAPVGLPPIIQAQPANQHTTPGRAIRFEVDAASFEPPRYQWQFQGAAIPGATNSFLEINNIQDQHAGEYRVEVSNSIGKSFSTPVVLSVSAILPGSVDPSFGMEAGINGRVRALALQDDGKWVIGGDFTNIGQVECRGIARLSSDGSLDMTFNPGAGISGDTNAHVAALALQKDGRILVGGQFVRVQEISRPGLARLNSDGSLDQTFIPAPGTNLFVQVIKPDPAGSILVGGNFQFTKNLDGSSKGFDDLVRLNADGSLDSSFNVGLVGMLCRTIHCWDISYVVDISIRSDGKMLIAGGFGGTKGLLSFDSRSLMCLDTNALKDPGFNSRLSTTLTIETGLDQIPELSAMTLQPDGKALIAGSFSFIDTNQLVERRQRRLARLNADGSRDASFNLETTIQGTVHTIAVDPVGRILLGGSFQSVNGVKRANIARLTTNGQLDSSFDPGPGPNGPVYEIIPVDEGSMMIGGAFTEVDGLKRPGVARLFGEDPSKPHIRFSAMENGSPVLHWQSFLGKRYILQEADSLSSSAHWTTKWEVVGDGKSTRFKDAPQTATQRYYRLKVE